MRTALAQYRELAAFSVCIRP
ncbi:hypothetical protein ACLK2F_21015 [Escherichia coli]